MRYETRWKNMRLTLKNLGFSQEYENLGTLTRVSEIGLNRKVINIFLARLWCVIFTDVIMHSSQISFIDVKYMSAYLP